MTTHGHTVVKVEDVAENGADEKAVGEVAHCTARSQVVSGLSRQARRHLTHAGDICLPWKRAGDTEHGTG